MALKVHPVPTQVQSVKTVCGLPHLSQIGRQRFVGQLRIHDFGLAGQRKVRRRTGLYRSGLVVSVPHIAVEFGSGEHAGVGFGGWLEAVLILGGV